MRRLISRSCAVVLLATALASCGPTSGAELPPTPYPFITATPQAETTLPSVSTPPETQARSPDATFAVVPPALSGTDTSSMFVTETSVPGTGCRYQPIGVFATVYQSDSGLAPSLGCVTGQTSGERPRLWTVSVEFQTFERGYMLWVSGLGWIKGKAVYVMLDDQTLTRFEDTYNPTSEPPVGTAAGPSGAFEPSGALRKVWRTQPGLSTRIGSAIAQAVTADTQLQMFQHGQMIDVPPAGVVIVLKQGQPGSWSLHAENQ